MNNFKGAFLTIFGGVCWGLSGTMGQYLFDVQGMDSRWLVPIRLGLAGVILLLWNLIRKGFRETIDPWKMKRNAIELIIYGLLGVSACQFFYFLTIQLSSATVATIMQDLSPAMIMLAVCLQAKRKPGRMEILSVVIGLAGVFLLTTHGNLSEMSVQGAAIITGVLSAVCVMIYNVVPKKLMQKYPVSLLQGWAFLMGGIFFSLLFRPWSVAYVPNGMGYLGIAFVVLVGNVLAFVSYMTGVRIIGPEKGILYGFSEPVTAAVIAFLALGSPFTIWDAIGFALIFLMLVMISSDGNKSKEAAETEKTACSDEEQTAAMSQ